MQPHIGEPQIGQDMSGESDLVREHQKLAERFDRVLGHKFPLVQPGNWPTKLRGIDALSIIPPPKSDDGEDIRSLSIIPFYTTPEGRRSHTTLTLLGTGEIMHTQELPWHLRHLRRGDAILREILDITEPLGYGEFRWLTTSREILPPGSWPKPELTSTGASKEKAPALPDPQRIEFLRKQPGILFGFLNSMKGGFNSYHAFVFSTFLLLEHPVQENAAYFIDFANRLDTKNLPTDTNLDTWLDQQSWVNRLSECKSEARECGATFIEHRGEGWTERMQKEIDRRMNPSTSP